MSLKRLLTFSLIIGAVIMLGTLLYRAGSGPVDPMPYSSTDGNQIENGIIECALDCHSLVSRGWPYSIVTLSVDDDRPQNYYRGLNWAGMLADYVVASGASFLVLVAVTRIRRRLPRPAKK